MSQERVSAGYFRVLGVPPALGREMSDEESGPFDEHLLTCEDCRNRVLEADVHVSAMYHAGTEIRGASQKRPMWSWSFAAASAVAVASAVLAGSVLMRAPRNMELQETHLYAMRGAAVSAKVAAQRPLLLIPDLTGLPVFPSYRLQVVDTVGKPVFTRQVMAADPTTTVTGVTTGMYFVRLSSPAGELLREYGLVAGR